jgi:hypothetical protein
MALTQLGLIGPASAYSGYASSPGPSLDPALFAYTRVGLGGPMAAYEFGDVPPVDDIDPDVVVVVRVDPTVILVRGGR